MIEVTAEDDRPPFFKNCPVCNAETPPGSITCPKCGVNLEIARANFVKDLALQVGKVGYVAGQYSAAPEKKRKITFGVVLGWVGACFLLLLLYGFVKDAGPYFLFSILSAFDPTPTSQPRPRSTPTFDSYNLTQAARFSQPSQPTQSDCLPWSAITTQMNGQTLCVFGVVYQITSSRETYTRIEFTDERNTFFLYSVNYYFTDETTGKELQVGDCISVTGKVGVISNVPYIDIGKENLYYCEPWMR